MPRASGVASGRARLAVGVATLAGWVVLASVHGARAAAAPSSWATTGRALAGGAAMGAPFKPPGGASATAAVRYWLGAGLSGHARAPGGRVELRSALSLMATPDEHGELSVDGVSLGAALLRRRLLRGIGLGSLAGELWAQWGGSRKLEGLALLNGLVAAGQTAASAGAWFASAALEPTVTWVGAPNPAVAVLDGLQRRGSAGVEALALKRVTRSLTYEVQLGWQERPGPAGPLAGLSAGFDSPHLGYTGLAGIRWQPAFAIELSAAAGVRWRPEVAAGVRPQVGAGLAVRSQGSPLRMRVELHALAEPGVFQGTDTRSSQGTDIAYSPLAAAASVELTWRSFSLTALAQYPPGACPAGVGCDLPSGGQTPPGRPDLAVSLRWSGPGPVGWVDVLWTQAGASGARSLGIAYRW